MDRFLVVGFGLAGSAVTYQLHRLGHTVEVVDAGPAYGASEKAAALLNPVVGKRWHAHPHTETYLETAKAYYSQLEAQFGKRYFQACEFLRYVEKETQGAFNKRLKEERYMQWLKTDPLDPRAVWIKGGGVLDAQALLADLRAFFEVKQGFFNFEAFDRDSYRAIIFCDGVGVAQNPFFKETVQLEPSKGEMILVEMEAELPATVVIEGLWIIEKGGGRYLVGATYDHNMHDCTPTVLAREKLLSFAQRFAKAGTQVTLLDHRVGIRPSSKIREPICLQHAQKKNLFALNGFGSRGALTIPYHSQQFLKDVLEKT